jgi:hypothetical protein
MERSKVQVIRGLVFRDMVGWQSSYRVVSAVMRKGRVRVLNCAGKKKSSQNNDIHHLEVPQKAPLAMGDSIGTVVVVMPPISRNFVHSNVPF